MGPLSDMTRRKLLVLAGGAAGALLPGDASAQRARPAKGASPGSGSAVAAPLRTGPFFSARELALLDEIAEAIIPADERSGGARAAKVAAFIEARMAESFDDEMRQSWKDDLAEIDRVARSLAGKSFVAATPAERTRVMERISRNEKSPKEPAEHAFGTIKWQVSFAYYKTRIGIHDELGYLGNVLLDEFLGTDVGKP